MPDSKYEYETINVKPERMKRFQQFRFELSAKTGEVVTHDDALNALLKKAGY